MRHDYLRIIYANDCASGARIAGQRRSALVSTRVGAGLHKGWRWVSQGWALVSTRVGAGYHKGGRWLALFCTMLLSSIKLNPAHPCLSFSCLPLPSLSSFHSLLFFLSFPSFSFLFPSFSFLFSLSSLNFCPQSLSPISFCLIFAKNRRNKDCLWTKRR